eukprot:3169726-Rhodomonas_salina.2
MIGLAAFQPGVFPLCATGWEQGVPPVDQPPLDPLPRVVQEHDEGQAKDGAVQTVQQSSALHDQRVVVQLLEGGVVERLKGQREEQTEDGDEEPDCDLARGTVPDENHGGNNDQLASQLEQLIPPAARLVGEDQEADVFDRLCLFQALAVPSGLLHSDITVGRKRPALMLQSRDQ